MGFWACDVGPSGVWALYKHRRITLGKNLAAGTLFCYMKLLACSNI